MQLIAGDAFKPMIGPSLATAPTTVRPTTIGYQQKSALTKQPPPSLYIDSKDVPVAEALRREPISRYRSRNRRPFKRYHSQNYNRPRRRPKPVYGPPSYSFDPQPNDFQFDTDFFDAPAPTYSVKPTKKKPTNVVAYDPKGFSLPKDYGGIVDTDIGKFYDSSSATFHVGPFKSTYDSSGSAFFAGAGATASGGSADENVDFDDLSNYKYIGSSSALGGESEFTFTAPSAAAAAAADDSDRFKFGSSFTSSGAGAGVSAGVGAGAVAGAGADPSPDYKFTSFGSDAGGGPYPPSTANFDASKFNLYAPQQQVVYQTAPKTLQSNRAKNVLTKPLTASYSFGSVSAANAANIANTANTANTVNSFNQQKFNTFETTFKQKPPSTSYGVPIAPALNEFTYQSSIANGNNANRYLPSAPSNVQSQNNNNFVPVSSISLTKSQEVGSALPEGHFAEPPPLNEQELAEVDDQLYRKPQSSYDATPKMRRASTTTRPPPTRRPSKMNSKRVTTQPPKISLNSREEFEYEIDDDDDSGGGDEASSYVVRSRPMPQPALPNSYDQEEFHTVTKSKRKPSRMPPQKNTDDFESYFDQAEISRKPKKPKAQRTPPPQQIDDVTDTNFEIPEDDYVDDIVRTPSTQAPPKKRPVPPPASRPKRPSKTTTPHILDTDDLRAAFAADLANQQFSPLGKSRRNPNRNRYQQERQQQQHQQDDDFYEDEVSQIAADRLVAITSSFCFLRHN